MYSIVMKAQIEKPNHWQHEVRAPFKKVMAWDALFFVLGIGVGAGIGAFLATA
jgi:hypothetical protein